MQDWGWFGGDSGLEQRFLLPPTPPDPQLQRAPWQRAAEATGLRGARTSPHPHLDRARPSSFHGDPNPRVCKHVSPPCPKMDSSAARRFQRGTIHRVHPAGGSRGARPCDYPPLPVATSLGTSRWAHRGAPKGEIKGTRWDPGDALGGSFSRVARPRVPPPEVSLGP